MALKFLGWLLATVLFLWGATRFMENRATYYPLGDLIADPGAVGLDFTETLFRTSDGLSLHGWYCLPSANAAHRADILFLHGNGGNISHRLLKLKGLADLGCGIFIFDYRGYGRSEGKPGDRGILLDAAAARRAFEGLRGDQGRPYGFMGESLGCLLAVRLAAEDPAVSFLVLEGSFPGKRAAVVRIPLFWPFLPFVSGALDMDGFPERVRCPVLVMHARHDEVIPFRLGQRVRDLFRPQAEFRAIVRGGHNDSFMVDEDFFPAIGSFLDRALRRG